MGSCKQYIDDILCGLRRLTNDDARILAAIFGTDEDIWSNLQEMQVYREQQHK